MAKDDDDPMKLSVQEFLREFHVLVRLKIEGLPCAWWEDDSERRDNEISRVGFTRNLARQELLELKAEHRHKGTEQDDHEKGTCALYVFRYPVPGEIGVEAYVKIAVKRHPSKRGIYVGKWYAFKVWGSGVDE